VKAAPVVILALTILGIFLFFAWFWLTQPLLVVPRRGAHDIAADPARLERDVRKLVSAFFPRDFSHPDNLAKAAAYLRAEFEETGAELRDETFQAEGERYRNVVAAFGPRSRELVVVGAHYDTHGELPGADDNASGVAGLLELARLLGRREIAGRVELAAYSLEELPFFGTREMGSAVHARSLRDSGARLRAMLCLEMIGCFSSEPNSQKFPFSLLGLVYPNRGDFIAVAGRLKEGILVRRVKRSMRSSPDLRVYSINAPRSLPGIDLSDNASYWNVGYPAVMITDTAFYRNERYHTAEDTPETLDYERMAKVVDGLLQTVLDLSGPL
jgi:Zn-dependent M28 family amino/carboxypeptidase